MRQSTADRARRAPAEAWPADMGSLTYTPRTVLAAGFSHLGAAPAGTVPKLRKNAKQPKPPKESKMSTPKVQIPAKRAPKRGAPDENYATQYVQRGTSGIEFARAIEAHILGDKHEN